MRREGALQELLKSDDLCHMDQHLAVANYDPSRLRVTRGDLAPREIAELTSRRAAVFAEDPLKWILKSDAEIAQEMDKKGTFAG